MDRTQPIYYFVHIKAAEFMVRLGVSEEERAQPQRLILSLNIKTSLQYISDVDALSIENVVDYAGLHAQVSHYLQKEQPFILLEHIGLKLSELLFENPLIQTIEMELIKPDIMENVDGVGVVFHFSRDDFQRLA